MPSLWYEEKLWLDHVTAAFSRTENIPLSQNEKNFGSASLQRLVSPVPSAVSF
jgi:hypothetical protein